MKTVENQAAKLQEHMRGTYFNLRVGIGVIGFTLPWLLWFGGQIGDHEPLRASMSAYYYSPTMRDTFVGALVAIGLFLYLYKGFSSAENWVLNLAGALAIGVAMVPTSSQPGVNSVSSKFHGTFAVLFFICIAYVCVFRASDTLSLIRDTRKANKLRAIYRLLGIGMVISPLFAVVLTFLLQPATQERSLTFFVEAVAVLIFATYWLTKSQEMKNTNAEYLALEGKLQAWSKPRAERAAPGRLVQIEP